MLKIKHQPQQRGMRFRYACEGRAAGSIPAANSTAEDKKWPSCQVNNPRWFSWSVGSCVQELSFDDGFLFFQILNYSGPAMMRVSLVTKEEPFRPHPHCLVGRDCANGFCIIMLEKNQDVGE